MSASQRPAPFNITQLPEEVAREIANYLRSAVFVPLANNVGLLRESCSTSMSAQKEILQQAQSQISTVIEPTAAELIPIAEELQDVYKQIDLLEGLINRVGENIKAMERRVTETEQAVRREEKYLDEGRPVELWHPASKEASSTKRFRAQDWVQNNRLIDTAAKD